MRSRPPLTVRPGALILGLLGLVCLAAGPARTGSPASSPSPSASPEAPAEGSVSRPLAAAAMVPPALPAKPGTGKGRLLIVLSGNRRWCTFPDDRVLKPAENPRESLKRGRRKEEVYTFGYKFTISTIKRGGDGQPLMLFESPVVRTATWMPAGKLGRGQGERKPVIGPGVGANPIAPRPSADMEGPATLVPHWDGGSRCTLLPEEFDFDLDPGVYDVYAAFDEMGRKGGWEHRTTGYLTDVTIEAGRRTRLEGIANMLGVSERELSFESATLLPEGTGTSGATGP